jgi:hypothetical protein
MEKQIEDLNEKGSGLENLSTFSNQNAPHNAIQDNKISSVVCQHGSIEAVLLEINQHPYKALQCLLGDVLVMLHSAGTQSSKPRCVETVKTTANYIKRIHRIHRSLFKAGAADPQYPRTPCQLTRIKGFVRDRLKEAGERLALNKSLTQFLTLYGIKETIKEPTELIAEAHRAVADFIEEGINGGHSK